MNYNEVVSLGELLTAASELFGLEAMPFNRFRHMKVAGMSSIPLKKKVRARKYSEFLSCLTGAGKIFWVKWNM